MPPKLSVRSSDGGMARPSSGRLVTGLLARDVERRDGELAGQIFAGIGAGCFLLIGVEPAVGLPLGTPHVPAAQAGGRFREGLENLERLRAGDLRCGGEAAPNRVRI